VIDNFGNYSSARGKKASSKFTKLKALFARRRADERNDEAHFRIETRDGLDYICPIPQRAG